MSQQILIFHGTAIDKDDSFRRTVDWIASKRTILHPEEVLNTDTNSRTTLRKDGVVFSFDDGYDNNYDAAKWLKDMGIHAIFFVIPSLINRTIPEYVQWHLARGVRPDVPRDFLGSRKGLSRSQLLEMKAMGHIIGAHNNAHRSLGKLHHIQDIKYEIVMGKDILEQMLSIPISQFAIAYGHVSDISLKAIKCLISEGLFIHMGFGYHAHKVGWPFFMRLGINPLDSKLKNWIKLCGIADIKYYKELRQLKQLRIQALADNQLIVNKEF